MDAPDSITMDPEARDDFLGIGGTGVISFASGDNEAPHTVPVSYGYDAAEETFYFRLATDGDSEKGDLTDRPVSFVVYDEIDGTWHSVVASGRLERTTDPEVATETLAGLERVELPLADVFGRPVSEVQFEFHRLVPESLTGRVESSTAP